ncbi:GntR family transcriptional regulator [Dactylosporangium sp. NPDC005572]|uniref:GntR family transcriptional regulator n=1 Tax=Dactylosporangium sp. NPDC005572 TaxID=3156889 RepID=UPI0033A397D6
MAAGIGLQGASRTTEGMVADVLRERIITGALPTGSRLRQQQIATELGVSTTPVREAFRTLATEGLVRIDEHRGVVVRQLTLEECIEIQELIVAVESDNLLHSVPRMDERTLDEAEKIVRLMARAGSRRSLLNKDLHLTLARPSQRKRAIALLDELLTLSALHVPTDALRIADRPAQSEQEHRALIAAARAGDAEEAAHILVEHCQPMLTLLRADLAARSASA